LLFRFCLLFFEFSPLAAGFLLVCVVSGGDLENFLDDEVVVFEILLLFLLEGGQFPVDAVQHLGIDSNLGHP